MLRSTQTFLQLVRYTVRRARILWHTCSSLTTKLGRFLGPNTALGGLFHSNSALHKSKAKSIRAPLPYFPPLDPPSPSQSRQCASLQPLAIPLDTQSLIGEVQLQRNNHEPSLTANV